MNNESLSVDKEQLKRPALKQAHVDRLERSGLTLSAYSQMTGIGKSTRCASGANNMAKLSRQAQENLLLSISMNRGHYL